MLECTFSPRARDRYHCNNCGGKPLNKAQLDGHRRTTYARLHPRQEVSAQLERRRYEVTVWLDHWRIAYDCPTCNTFHSVWSGRDVVCTCGTRIHVKDK